MNHEETKRTKKELAVQSIQLLMRFLLFDFFDSSWFLFLNYQFCDFMLASAMTFGLDKTVSTIMSQALI